MKTKKEFEEYLNECSPEYCSSDWIIGGKNRNKMYFEKYGAAIRRHDPIAFEVSYNDWKRE